MRSFHAVTALLALIALATHSGCRRTEVEEVQRPLTVHAASSLQEVVGEFARGFTGRHPGSNVSMSFTGTQTLALQLEHGAKPDVFAAADVAQLEALEQKGLVHRIEVLACNTLVIAVPAQNPAKLTGLGDLPNAERIVLAAPEVPAGAYTRQLLQAASARYGAGFADSVDAKVVSREPNVRQTLNRVVMGDADAAIVYRTDARAAGDKVLTIELPPDLNVIARLGIARAGDGHPLAGTFISELMGPEGQPFFTRAGFFLCPEPGLKARE